MDGHIEIGFSANDETYGIDFSVKRIKVPECANGDKSALSKAVADFVIEEALKYETDHLV